MNTPNALIMMAALLAAGCGGDFGTNPMPDVHADGGQAVAFVAPTATPTPAPTPTEEPVRRNRATPTPEPTSDPEPEPTAAPIVVNRGAPTPTPWMSCENPDFAPPNVTLSAVTSTGPTTVTVFRIVAEIASGDEIMGGVPSPWVGAGQTLTYQREGVARSIHFTWTLTSTVGGGQLTCRTVRGLDVAIPAL
jgi:hypothetical protein